MLAEKKKKKKSWTLRYWGIGTGASSGGAKEACIVRQTGAESEVTLVAGRIRLKLSQSLFIDQENEGRLFVEERRILVGVSDASKTNSYPCEAWIPAGMSCKSGWGRGWGR